MTLHIANSVYPTKAQIIKEINDSGFSKQYGVHVDNVIIMVMQHLFRDVATFHVTEFLSDGGCVTRDYYVTPVTTQDVAEIVMNEDKYKARMIRYGPDICHYDTIVSLPKNDRRTENFSAYYYQAFLQQTCTLASGRFCVKYSKVAEVNGLRRGRGLYANVKFKKGALIGWYPCTPFNTNPEGDANAIGTYRFAMASGGPDYDNHPESLKISEEENSQTACCDLLDEDANTMGLA